MALLTIVREIRRQANGWMIVSLLGAVLVLLPLLPILSSLFHPANENWLHIRTYLIKDYVLQSLSLVAITGVLTALLGVSLSWLIAAYDFPMRRFFRWALMLPLAIPPYVAAYTYSTMFGFTGAIQQFLRSLGIQPDPRTFGIMSTRGAVFIFVLFLFPYVYMVTRAYLERQSGSYVENAILLGRGPLAIFWHVVLPIARPAIISGVALVMFEVLADYGVTSYFGVHTITTAIFRTWFGMYDVDSAVRLAAWLMIGILALIVGERLMRANRRYSPSSSKLRPLAPRRLQGLPALVAWLFCALVFACSFLIPLVQLLVWASWTYADVLTSSFALLTYRTASVALVATAITLLFAVAVANFARVQANPLAYGISRLVTTGYSLPGAIVAIGALAFFIALDNRLAPFYGWLGLGESPLVLSLSLVMLVVAYVVRFMATSFNAVEAGFEKIGTRYMEVSRTLGHGVTASFFRIELPLMRGALFSGAVLTFVEIVKELPLALLLRPFNFETLATKTYQYANNEQIFEAAVPSLFLIAVSMLSVWVFHRVGEESAS